MEDAGAITLEQVDSVPNNGELLKFILRAVIQRRDMAEAELEGALSRLESIDSVLDHLPVDIEELLGEDVEELLEETSQSLGHLGNPPGEFPDVITRNDEVAARKARIAKLTKSNEEV